MTQLQHAPLEVDRALWEFGLTLDEFAAGIDTLREETQRRLREVRLSAGDAAFFARITAPIYVLALTEGWCGDSLMNLPILARIVEAAPDMRLRVFARGEWPELAALYHAQGITNIPVFAFFDADFRPIGTWVERSRAAHILVEQWRATHPEAEALRGDPRLTDDQRRARLKPIYDGLRHEMEQWYADGLQAATVAEIKTLFAGLA